MYSLHSNGDHVGVTVLEIATSTLRMYEERRLYQRDKDNKTIGATEWYREVQRTGGGLECDWRIDLSIWFQVSDADQAYTDSVDILVETSPVDSVVGTINGFRYFVCSHSVVASAEQVVSKEGTIQQRQIVVVIQKGNCEIFVEGVLKGTDTMSALRALPRLLDRCGAPSKDVAE